MTDQTSEPMTDYFKTLPLDALIEEADRTDLSDEQKRELVAVLQTVRQSSQTRGAKVRKEAKQLSGKAVPPVDISKYL